MMACVFLRPDIGMAALQAGVTSKDPAHHGVHWEYRTRSPHIEVRVCVCWCTDVLHGVCVRAWVLVHGCLTRCACVCVQLLTYDNINEGVSYTTSYGTDNASLTQFVRRARKEWSPTTHSTYSTGFKDMVHTMLLVANRIYTVDCKLYMPSELWYLICSFALRSWHQRLD